MALTPQKLDYSEWYLDVAKQGELFEYAPVSGCITFLPKATKLWDMIRTSMQEKLDLLGVQNLLLPLLIPMSYFEREKDHVEWFAPELAVVTHGGWKELEEPYAIRPTSELLFCNFFKDRLKSYRDLPLLYNQWVNVMRWEKRTRPFLRTTEFYWQEWHTLHETRENANEFALSILHDVYIATIRDMMAIEWIVGKKSESEKFAGADTTYTYEPMMGNGWALQICTSHLLGQGFMRGFDIAFQNREGKLENPWYTSWWLSTRSIWGIISSHSDDRGLIIPPRMSEYAATLLPIYGKDNYTAVNTYTMKVAQALTLSESTVPVKWEYFRANIGTTHRILIDYRNIRLWEKITDWELSGYPIRIECGERDVENNSCVVVSRITGEKTITSLSELQKTIERMQSEGQKALQEKSRKRLEENTIACTSLEEIWEAIEAWKFVLFEWDKNREFETLIKERFKATTRCIPFEWQFTDRLLEKKQDSTEKVIIARNF